MLTRKERAQYSKATMAETGTGMDTQIPLDRSDVVASVDGDVELASIPDGHDNDQNNEVDASSQAFPGLEPMDDNQPTGDVIDTPDNQSIQPDMIATGNALDVEHEDDDEKVTEVNGEENVHAPTRHSGIAGASMNFVNSIVGAGIIGLPYALYHSGFILGIFLLCWVAFLIDYGVRRLVYCGIKVKKVNFEEVTEYAFGENGFYAVTICMFLFAYGAMVAYHVVIGDTIPPIIEELSPNNPLSNRGLIVFLYSIVFMFPLSLLRNMASLKSTSSLSIAAVVIIVILVAIEAPKASHVRNDKEYTLAKSTWFAGVGTMSFAFVCHHNSFLVYKSLRNNTPMRWRVTTHLSVMVSLGLSLFLAIVGYSNFQSDTKGDVLNNFSYDSIPINIARGLLAMTMVFTFPMENFVSRHCLLQILMRKKIVTTANYNRYYYGLTVGLWGSSLAIGASITDLGIVLELVGVVAGSLIGYILPGLIALRVDGYHRLKNDFIRTWKGESTAERGGMSRSILLLNNATASFVMPLVLVAFGSVALLLGLITIILVQVW